MNNAPRFEIIAPGETSRITVYIETFYNYSTNDEDGFIEFDGYIYYDIGNEIKHERRLDKALLITSNVEPNKELVEIFEVEFTKREIIKNTNCYSLVNDEDEEEMKVCFFPTDHQRVYFKKLREIKMEDPIPTEYKF